MQRFLFVASQLVTRHGTATAMHPSHACGVNHCPFFLLMTQQLKEWEWPLVVVLICSMASVKSHPCARCLAKVGLLMTGGQSWVAQGMPQQQDHICSRVIGTLMGLPRGRTANLGATLCCKSPCRWSVVAAGLMWHLFSSIFLYKAQSCVGCASHSFQYSTWRWGATGNWDMPFSSELFILQLSSSLLKHGYPRTDSSVAVKKHGFSMSFPTATWSLLQIKQLGSIKKLSGNLQLWWLYPC